MHILFLEEFVLLRRPFLVQLLLDVFDGILVARRAVQPTGFDVLLLLKNPHALRHEPWHLQFIVPFHQVKLDAEDKPIVWISRGVHRREGILQLIPHSLPLGVGGFFLFLRSDDIGEVFRTLGSVRSLAAVRDGNLWFAGNKLGDQICRDKQVAFNIEQLTLLLDQRMWGCAECQVKLDEVVSGWLLD